MEPTTGNITNKLDAVKHIRSNGVEYWMAREIQGILGYTKWEKFKGVIEKAKMSCESTGIDPPNHFLGTGKMVTVGSGAEVEKEDCFLSRYACYLIAMNGDPRKLEIGEAQTYFAFQTRRQEKFDELPNAEKRIMLRDRVRINNKQLASAAKHAGVKQKDFGIFQDAGYRGLYALGLSDIKRKKNIPSKDGLLDRAGPVELAANDFRITQTEQKLRIENIQGQEAAINTHREVGQEVRTTIKKIGGTMPEDLPPEQHIKKLKAGRKRSKELNPPAST